MNIILDRDDLKVTDVHTQWFVKNLLKRSVRLDILATDSAGKRYNIEIERCTMETGEVFGDEAHIIYVNGSCKDDTPLGKLMYDFSCTNPKAMNYNVLSDRARYFKEEEGGVAVMCKAMEDMRKESLEEGKREGLKEGKKETAFTMLKTGRYSEEEIAEVTGLTIEEVKSLS